MPTIVYLDPDDEITSAAARIRTAATGPVGLVVPYGSRLATSRINFRLLAREADNRDRRLSIVAPDAATRALALSAGLAVYGSVSEFESALEAPIDPGASDAATAPGGAGSTADGGPSPVDAAATRPMSSDPSPTVVVPVVTAADAAALAAGSTGAPRPTAGPATPTVRPGTGLAAADRPIPAIGRPRPPLRLPRLGLIAVGLAVLALVLVGIGAYAVLPSATIILTPRVEGLGPIRLTVLADPDAGASDPASPSIPASRLTFDIDATDTFPATGERVEEAAAAGRVTFSNLNTGGPNQIPAGSIVSTEGGVQFRTTAAITLPAAEIILGIPIEVRPSTKDVAVEAVKSGPAGNVPANAITVVPKGEDPTLTKVRNADATIGGRRQVFTLVSQADVDAALAALADRLPAAFEDRLADPDAIPAGATLFAATQRLGDAAPVDDPGPLVGQELTSFDVTVRATGSVVVVDEAPLQALAADRLRSSIDAGHRLVADSIQIVVDDPSVDGERVSFPITVRASQVAVVDEATIRAAIKGLQLPQARSVLAQYGEARVTVWPDWVTAIPTLDARLTITIEDPAPLEGDS